MTTWPSAIEVHTAWPLWLDDDPYGLKVIKDQGQCSSSPYFLHNLEDMKLKLCGHTEL